MTRAASGGHLPSDLLSTLEPLLGVDLAQVRVHLSSLPDRIGAEAFAYGDDVFVDPRSYQPRTKEGWRLLGHELAHVAQQRLQLINNPASTGSGSILWDPLLEAEADLVGNCAAAIYDGEWEPQEPIYRNAGARDGRPSLAIQCLMKWDDFKAATKIVLGKRDQIVPVDNALKEFHRLNDEKPRDYVRIFAQLRALYAACQAYGTAKPNSKRKTGVDKLIREIALEEPILGSFASAQQSDGIAKWDHVDEALRRYLKFQNRADYTRSNTWGELDDMITQFSSMKANVLTTAIVKQEIESLKGTMEMPGIPRILRSCVNEVTSPALVNKLDLTVWLPGAKYNLLKDKSINKYTLKHSLTQNNGKSFRIGSILHELTHVSIAESFDNTQLMFAISPRATDADILREAVIRRGNIVALKKALNETSDDQIPSFLKDEMLGKAHYPLSGKLGTYLANFRTLLPAEEYQRFAERVNNFETPKARI